MSKVSSVHMMGRPPCSGCCQELVVPIRVVPIERHRHWQGASPSIEATRFASLQGELHARPVGVLHSPSFHRRRMMNRPHACAETQRRTIQVRRYLHFMGRLVHWRASGTVLAGRVRLTDARVPTTRVSFYAPVSGGSRCMSVHSFLRPRAPLATTLPTRPAAGTTQQTGQQGCSAGCTTGSARTKCPDTVRASSPP